MKKLIFALALFPGMLHTASAQWSQGKGDGYFKLAGWYLETDQHFTDTGDIDPNVTRSQFISSLYVEYGLAKRLDVVAYVPFFARATRNATVSGSTGDEISPGEGLNSLGDTNIGLEWNIYQRNRLAAAIQLTLGLPTGESAGGSDGSFQTGDGEFNQYVSIRLGYSIPVPKNNWYAKFYAGLNNRTEDFSDELRFGLESGVNLLDRKLLVLGRINVVESLQNGSLNAANRAPGNIFANNVEYWSVGGEINYKLGSDFGLSLGLDGAFSGRLIAANPSFTGGVYYILK